jgi:diguanylate cyclase (GGDEF)-like protein
LVDQITHQARHDQLTGLANRLRFGEQLRAAMSRAREQGAVVQLYYIDLDRFKPVNDEFGHAVGDRLLAAVGERLKACTRPGDTVARLGGDEFAVLIETAGAVPDSERLGERLVQTLEQPFDIDGHLLTLGASVGRAAFPDDGIDPDALVRAADAAMFAAKRGHQQGYGLPLR